MKYGYAIILLCYFLLTVTAAGQHAKLTVEPQWYSDEAGRDVLFNEGVSFGENPMLLKYRKTFSLQGSNNSLLAFFEKVEEERCTGITAEYLSQYTIAENYTFRYGVSKQRQQLNGYTTLLPFRKGSDGKYYKLTQFTIEYIGQQKMTGRRAERTSYANKSVLAEGTWYKIATDSSGIYSVGYDDLSQMGFSVDNLQSSKIHLYGRPGGMLPERVGDFRHDDLPEIPIKVVDGGDGTFDSGDYFLFYGQSPHTWRFDENNNRFKHIKHLYSEKQHYFITINDVAGKRITESAEPEGDVTTTVTTFDEILFHEEDAHNLLKSGRNWLGEKFDLETSHQYLFDIPSQAADEPIYFKGRFVARSTQSSSFTINAGGTYKNVTIPSISLNYNNKYAEQQVTNFTFSSSQNPLSILLTYNKSNSSSVGWLDYIELNLRRRLNVSNGQLDFRDHRSVGADKVSRFEIGYAAQQPEIWDVSNPVDVKKMAAYSSGGKVAFKAATDSLREFIAFDGSSYLEVEKIGSISNQNLHGITQGVNYVILATDPLRDQARRLADFHRNTSKLSVRVINPEKIYNEFSSGTQDITAIRDFLRMLYERNSNGNDLRYVLLFGDGSYDYKDITEGNTNIIPTYQSDNSLHPVSSYATDDYFGYLDPDEGLLTDNRLDIGLGRLPITTAEEAAAAVDKIIRYGSDSIDVMGDWRNQITFIGDDEDNNSHMDQANQLANYVADNYPDYHTHKIFFDAFAQETTSGGQRYPDVNEAINTRVEKGALIVNYTGHGGEVGWAHERVLGISDIENWSNRNKLPVFVTATCEFTRFDDPERTSAGELVFLHENGGGIALFTTTRATYGNPNFTLNKNFYNHAFERNDGEYYRMGDLIRLSKSQQNSGNNGRKFILIGDPALQMAYPEYKASLTHINSEPVEGAPDTLQALSQVTMSGEIRNTKNDLKTDFNGIIYPSIYDKEVTITTLANDDDSYPMDFKVQRNILYQGKADIKNGKFQFTFIVPKDIDYKMGYGKISLYAASDNRIDANGFFKEVVVGGFNENAETDNEGPDIQLYIDDTTFREGGITDSNPTLYATISDENGINTVGNGIGHDLVAYIDTREDVKVLNDYYVSALNRYNKGTVTYPFFNVPEGEHTLHMKAWDVYNNSSEASLDFVVVAKDNFRIKRLINYPNPMSSYTNFVFEHNQKNEDLEIEIQIFTSHGKLVKTINKSIFAEGYQSSPIQWHGDSDYGANLRRGIYIYKVTVKSKEGRVAEKSSKLLLIR